MPDSSSSQSAATARDGGGLEISFPPDARVAQDEEWCEVGLDGDARRIRFHDYAAVYSIPGLYEQLFYDELECRSPATVRALLEERLGAAGFEAGDLRVLDVGAGNGMVGEELAAMGAGSIVGVDIIEEAAQAAGRDRPGVYDDYLVVDLTDLPADARQALERHRFNCLTSVAALGFGDIPPRAFAQAYNLVADRGLVAFTIKEEFLRGDRDATGFARLIARMLAEGAIETLDQRRYRHRLSVAREPLHYVAMIATKVAAVPLEWVAGAERSDGGGNGSDRVPAPA